MRDAIANLVFPVLNQGLALKEALAGSSPPEDIHKAQRELQNLLHAPTPERDFIGDGHSVDPRAGANVFLGARYALVCWLDEIFIVDSPWKNEWKDHTLEQALFDTRDRAWKFWEQANHASARPGTDALETYYLCAMLGFRGNKKDKLPELKTWREQTESRLKNRDSWTEPAGRQPPLNVPPLRGERRRYTMTLVAGAMLLALIPISVFLVLWSQAARTGG